MAGHGPSMPPTWQPRRASPSTSRPTQSAVASPFLHARTARGTWPIVLPWRPPASARRSQESGVAVGNDRSTRSVGKRRLAGKKVAGTLAVAVLAPEKSGEEEQSGEGEPLARLWLAARERAGRGHTREKHRGEDRSGEEEPSTEESRALRERSKRHGVSLARCGVGRGKQRRRGPRSHECGEGKRRSGGDRNRG